MMSRLIVFLLAAAIAFGDMPYQTSIEQWRQQREASLKADGGWLTVAGLIWLKDGANAAGSDASSDIVLPRGPAKAGVFEFHDGKITFHPAPGAAILVNGKAASVATEMKPDTEGKPDQVTLDGLTMFVIHRGNRYAIRLKDTASKFRKEFTALQWFPVDPSYRVTAKFVAYKTPTLITIPNILGETEKNPSPGYVLFTLRGHEFRLDPVAEDDQLFFIFHDETSGKETYPPGRFLYSDLAKDGKVVLDFNKAYNPPCAFTPYATCPLPPKQNRLAVRIEAGERKYGNATH
jgi:uncharacterized protein (DUF1684 family)